jgi:crotonobetainyl-CoA:carnitine CoA-transferase CaiB-like acyl-CoA transferase
VRGLAELRVVDLSDGLAGAYAAKLFADAGAEVVKVEPAGGHALRRRSAGASGAGSGEGALFRFLAGGQRSLVGAPGDSAVRTLVAGADLVVESFAPGAFDAEALAREHPGLVVLSITPFGRIGPWRERPWTEFTLQAQCGSIGTRGLPGAEPFQAGGETTLWLAGTYAAVAALAAVARARRSGHGEHVDFSLYEALTIACTNYMDLSFRLLGSAARDGLPQSIEAPSIEPTADGWVGFCTNSRQQVADFLLLIGRPDLRDDPRFAQVHGRVARLAEWNALVHAWTRTHTTAEVLEQAALLRIPVAPVSNGDTVGRHEQVRARGMLVASPHGPYLQPRPPIRYDDRDPPPPRPAPRIGEGGAQLASRRRERPAPDGAPSLPLAGTRVLDMTAWWAGPSATHMLAALGAEVVHLESPTRIDGMRSTGGMARQRFPDWWEASAFFAAANSNKLGLALDLAREEGRALARRLIAVCDAVVENYTPRVLDGFGLGWDAIRAIAPRCILVRMPAFGLSGPWRDHTGFAQTMEQLSGLAWVTGHRDDQPRIQRGPCDPLAGMHAAWALLVALAERARSGRGLHVECTMVEGALNAAAEQILEWGVHGRLLERMGNRSPFAAPQGLYPCRGSEPGRERWLALSVDGDARWRALVELLGRPAWALDPELASAGGRVRRHDAIDAQLRAWCSVHEREALVEQLLAAGVPAAPVADPRDASACPQHRARGFFEEIEHPVLGRHPVPSVPFRYRRSVSRWLRAPAPTLGQHNHEILGGWLGLAPAELDRLERAGVIGTRPAGS